MNATFRKEVSLHGHRLDVLKSSLQKYIRRGCIEGAMYSVAELDLFSECVESPRDVKRIRTNMIHRLMIQEPDVDGPPPTSLFPRTSIGLG